MQATIDAAVKEEKWRLEPALKRATLNEPSENMNEIKKWRAQPFNLENRPRKFNSWVANRPFEEYQADLFCFNNLRQPEKVQTSTAN